MRRTAFALMLVVFVGFLWPGSAFPTGVQDPLERPALQVRHPAKSVLLDVCRAGKRLVAVGERGVVVLSDDGGGSWRQVEVPTSVSLTAVQFPTETHGWAVGHGGVVLHSEDGGETWTRQLDGVTAARLAFQGAEIEVRLKGPEDEGARRRLEDAQRLVEEGPDKPFLDLYFQDDRSGFIVGAYGLVFHTEDGGRTWRSWIGRIENPDGYHLYTILAVGKNLYLSGEFGLFFRSTDGGLSFERLQTPYEGTYFTLAAAQSGEIVLAGLRGNAYWSADQGATFTPVQVPVQVSFSASAGLADGRLVFANQAGFILESRDGGRSMQVMNTSRLAPVSAILALGNESLVAVGLEGAICVTLAGKGPPAMTGGAR